MVWNVTQVMSNKSHSQITFALGVGYVADVTYSKVIPGSGERSHTK